MLYCRQAILLCLSLCERQAFGLIDQAQGTFIRPKILGVIWSSLTGN